MKNPDPTLPQGRTALLSQLIENFQQSHRSIIRIKSKQTTGLPHAQRALLLTVDSKNKSNIKELSQILDITPAAITQQVEILVEQNLLIREIDSNDRRNVIVSLSKPGLELVKKLQAIRLEKIKGYFANITDQQLDNFVDVLKKVNQNIRKDL
ncbi:MarR family transcriptional regulator [Candidatus Saccharibacteria bacterium]|nr:MarR family transcriptional regulator [Candidatus Saccharibacteria bacterium]